MISTELVDLSRWQFALTSMYHFIFVPLTLGLSFMLVVMEACYVVTGKEVYKDMTKFWGKLFGVNFALGVATGITMEFQFGTMSAIFSAPPLPLKVSLPFSWNLTSSASFSLVGNVLKNPLTLS